MWSTIRTLIIRFGGAVVVIVLAGALLPPAIASAAELPEAFLPVVLQSDTAASAGTPAPYDIGNPTLRDLWVDPVNGNDSRDGLTRANALRTIGEAWRRIPIGSTLSTTGYRIQLVRGTYPESSIPVYWEDRHGTAAFPIILNSADGAGAARLQGNLNIYDVDYLYLLGLDIRNNGDVFHCELCRHILIRDTHLDGNGGAQETIKVNQSQYFYIENSDIHGAYENPIDFVAVQYGQLLRNKVHDGGDWCAYVKGGSAYINVEANWFYDCGTGGFTAGQGTGFEYMVNPWLHYETYAIRIVNNIIHDTYGAGLGVNGGYQILIAYNTLYRIGARSHVLEVVFGGRTCDGDRTRCAANLAAGGWGTSVIGWDGSQPIPNRDVYVINNLIINPSGYQSQWQQFAVYGPQTPTPGSNIPTPAVTDQNLRIRGNVISNGPADHPLGVGGDSSGCRPANPTCNVTQLLADNAINTVTAALVNPAGGDYRPANASALPPPIDIPSFPAWATFRPVVSGPGPVLDVPVDAAGNLRSGANLVGAYASGATPPAIQPTLTSFSPLRARAAATVTILGTRLSGATAVSFNGVAAASYRVVSAGKIAAVVPVAAADGPIGVTTPEGTATSAASFTFIPPAPTITGFSVGSAQRGEQVVINGTNLDRATKVVFYYNKPAVFTVLSPTQIQVAVPSRAISGKVKVVTPGGSATSSVKFIVR